MVTVGDPFAPFLYGLPNRPLPLAGPLPGQELEDVQARVAELLGSDQFELTPEISSLIEQLLAEPGAINIDPDLQRQLDMMQQGLNMSDGNVRPEAAASTADPANPFGSLDQDLLALIVMWFESLQQQRSSTPQDRGQLGGQNFSGTPGRTNWPAASSGSNGSPTSAPPSSAPPGSTAAGNPTRADLPAGTQLSAPAPWISQFDASQVENAGRVACYRGCRAMMKAVGIDQPPTIGNALQVANGEDGSGRVSTTPAQTAAATNHIDDQLAQGRPVTVGVSYKDANYNEGFTDHFVVITGKGVDEDGNVFYSYNDPGSNQGQNRRFFVDQATGNLYDPDPAFGGRFDLSMVVPSNP